MKLLSVCMITGDVGDSIRRTLGSVRVLADELCIVQTKECEETKKGIEKFAETYDGEVKHVLRTDLMHEDGYMRSFSDARNVSWEMATCPWQMWIDTDDTIYQPDILRVLIEDIEANGVNGKQVDVISMDYDYEFDTHGRCTTRHSRERIIRTGCSEWIAPIHEVLTWKRPCNYMKLARTDSYIIHDNVVGERDTARDVRNCTMLKRIVESDECDARMKMYYANALGSLGQTKAAAHYYKEYLNESQWDQERYSVFIRLCDLYKKEKEFELAGAWAGEAVRLLPSLRDGYLALAEVSALKDKWDEVIEWLEIYGLKKKQDAAMVTNPTALELKPWILGQQAHFRMGNFEDSIRCSRQLIELLPERKEDLEAHIAICAKQLRDISFVESIEAILARVPEEDHHKIYSIIPNGIARDYPKFARNRPKSRPQGKKVCAIYCGFDDTKAWGPESIKEGIGGSEEAVINISRELAAQDWHVEVYANVTKEFADPDTGVVWYSAFAANPDDLVDLCILWRHPQLKKTAPKSHVTWLWNHDLQDGMRPFYDEATMEGIDSVLFLSEFHRETAPWVPEDKCFYTTNGVDSALMLQGKNDPKTVIYASSPDRGLPELLKAWPKVTEADPEARLKVFYGYNEWFDRRYANDPSMLAEKRWCLDTMEEDPTITYYGNVGQDVLAEHISTAGVWAYPTRFGEISCITAMKMQCGGAIPVCSRYAALEETVQHGVKLGSYKHPDIDMDDFTNALIKMLKDKMGQARLRTIMKPWARTKFTWTEVAKKWIARYFKDREKSLEAASV